MLDCTLMSWQWLAENIHNGSHFGKGFYMIEIKAVPKDQMICDGLLRGELS